MEDLPHDVLAHILLSSPLVPNDKLAISAVSRRLRHAVLDMPLLWSSIEIRAKRDLLRLEAFVARSRTALLDVTVCPDDRGVTDAMWVHPYQRNVDKVAMVLLPHVARFRSFRVDLYDLAAMAPFLDANLVYERLVELVIHGSSLMEQPLPISLVAPELEVAELAFVHARDWSTMTRRLRDLTVISNSLEIITPSFMDQLIYGSTTLRRLVLAELDIEHETAPLKGLWMFPHLQHLELDLSSARTLDILQSIPTAQIHSVSFNISDGIVFELYHRNDPHPIIAQLLHGAGNIAAFAIKDTYTFAMVTSSGRRRDIRPAAYSKEIVLTVWRYLCHHHSAHESLTSCAIDASIWHWYDMAFNEYPPLGPDFVLRLSGNRISTVPSVLDFPTLAKVVLEDLGFSEVELCEQAIRWLAKGAIRCTRSKVPICICDCARRNTDIRNALEERLPGNLGGSLAADPSYGTRWFICPGDC